MKTGKWAGLGLAILASAVSMGQSSTPLTLEEALGLAKKNNGSVRSAYLNFEAAKADRGISLSAFLPTVTPSITQENGRAEQYTGLFKGRDNIDTTSALLEANWRLLDNGTRRLSLKQSELNQDSLELTALQTLRSTLFDVHSRFYEALRRQELLKVQDSQLKRAAEILEQTKFRASDRIGDAPKKDIKQAEADFLNSKVSFLTAQNRVSTSLADLKAVIGMGPEDSPSLTGPQMTDPAALPYSLEAALKEGLTNRSDLLATRKRIDGQKLRVRSAQLDGGIQYAADVRYRRSFSEDVSDRATLVLSASVPLYDGQRTRLAVKSQSLALDAQSAQLVQAERSARAEIESGYKEFTQNRERLTAARAALAAAQVNYEAAKESQKEGAADLIEVLTAQVSLATAESNLVEAVYDTLIAEVRLRLALGREMPGEKD